MTAARPSVHSPRRRRVEVLAGCVLLALTLGSCANVPSSGPVVAAGDDSVDQQVPVRYEAPAPVRGLTPTQVVAGFLDAQQAFPASVETAAKFLTPDAAESWRPGVRTVVYDDPRPQGSLATVRLVARRVATVSGRGHYAAAPDTLLTTLERFALEQVDGEWRIANPPDATYVSEAAFQRYYRPFSLFFLDVTGKQLVPEPVWYSLTASLPTELLRGLVTGPSQRLGRVVITAVPGAGDEVSTVLTSDGVAVVRLPASAASLSVLQRELLSAQLVRTLGQAPEVVGVRVLLGEAPIDLPGVPGVQPVGSYEDFDPAVAPTGQLYALRRGRLVSVAQGAVAETTGSFGEKAQDIGDFDVKLDGQRNTIAALSPGGDRVLVGDLAGGPADRPRAWYSGDNLLGPSWDRYGSLWAVDRDGATSKVLSLTARRARDVTPERLLRSRVLSYSISPDGARFAAVVRGGTSDPSVRNPAGGARRGPPTGGDQAKGQGGQPSADQISDLPRIMIGRVVRGDDGSVLRVDRVQPLVTAPGTLTRPLDVAWRDPTNLVALAHVEGGLPEPYTVRIDGSVVTGPPAITPLDDRFASDVASSGNPQDPVYVADERGELVYQDNAGRWVPVSAARLRFPNFPDTPLAG